MAAETGGADASPSSSLPVTVAGTPVLVRDAGVLAYLGPICAYRTGFTVQLTISVDPAIASDQVISMGGRTRQERALRPRLQVRCSGEVADSAARPTGTTPVGQLVLQNCGGQWTANGHPDPRHTSTWWVSPLPRIGQVEFALFLLGAAEPSGTAQLDAAQINAAARQSVALWAEPERARDDAGE